MSQEKVFAIFNTLFPQFSGQIESWFPNGKNSIRIRRFDNQDFIFTYNEPMDWRFETVDSFINGIHGKEKRKCNA